MVKKYPLYESLKEDSLLHDNSSTFDGISKFMFTSHKKVGAEIESSVKF
jgi:hypothetical protein